MNNFTHLSLFSGIGGLDLAAEWAGFKTVGQCEFADYPTKVLKKHWPDVPRWRDIRTLTKESFYDRTGLHSVDVISGGFPCQPFSVAGKQKGKEDDRYLWPEMLRVIRELTPCWVIGENVPGILRIAGRTVCEDLEREGYAVTVFNFEAAAVGAPHRRERMFFVGWNPGGRKREQQCEISEIQEQNAKPSRICADVANARCVTEREQVHRTGLEQIDCCKERFGAEARYRLADSGENVAYSERGRQQGQRELVDAVHSKTISRGSTTEFVNGCVRNQWAVEPAVGRVANGVPNRVDRLKCLGNAVVPQQAYPIFKAIAEIERTVRNDHTRTE
jgi:DNA (cytosine-5)-methyltransferase 1